MNDINLINPLIRHKACECPHCGGPISILTSDVTEIYVNTDGLPISYDTIRTLTKGYCPRCGIEYPNVIKIGINYDLRYLK
jgi:hypothetical protein